MLFFQLPHLNRVYFYHFTGNHSHSRHSTGAKIVRNFCDIIRKQFDNSLIINAISIQIKCWMFARVWFICIYLFVSLINGIMLGEMACVCVFFFSLFFFSSGIFSLTRCRSLNRYGFIFVSSTSGLSF